jgi:hypothetical protein
MNKIPDSTSKENPNIKGYDENGFPIYTDDYMKQQMKKPVDYADIYNDIVTVKEKEIKDESFDAMLEGTVKPTKEDKLSPKNTANARKEILKNAQELDEEYLALIDTVEIVTARLMLKLDPEANIKTVRSRLNRLVDKKKIKQKKPNKITGGLVYFHSNNYKPSALDRHNLWIASTMIGLFNDDFDSFSDKDILKNPELNNYRFTNGVLNYNFIPDIVGIKDNLTVAVEVEISRKTGKQKSKEFQDKIEAYVYSLRTGKFSVVQYFTDDNYIIKQFEKWKKQYNGDHRLNIFTVTDEELLLI